MLVKETISDLEKTESLQELVVSDTPMKDWLIGYVGNNYEQERQRLANETGKLVDWDNQVTVEMIVELMAKEFPEFLMAIAEENFIRGYRQAFADTEAGMELASNNAHERNENGQ
jgi:hypothetical protein